MKTKVSKSVKKFVENAIAKEVEDKYLYATLNSPIDNGTTIGPVGIQLLGGITQGVAYNQRVGDKIRVKKFELRTTVIGVLNGGTNYQPHNVRCILARMNAKAVTAAVAANSIPQPYGSPNGVLYDNGVGKAIVSQQNPDTCGSMYHVLFDKTIKVAPQSTSSADHGYGMLKITKHFKGLLAQYENGSNNLDKGDLFLMFFSDSPLPNQSSILYDLMIHYQDA